jgi:hypothetical protein
MKCAYCRRELEGTDIKLGYFEVTRYDASGQNCGNVKVCSAICLLQWTYAFVATRGMQGAKMIQQRFHAAKEMFNTLIGALKGPSKGK